MWSLGKSFEARGDHKGDHGNGGASRAGQEACLLRDAVPKQEEALRFLHPEASPGDPAGTAEGW